jgi:hypothetical protein
MEEGLIPEEIAREVLGNIEKAGLKSINKYYAHFSPEFGVIYPTSLNVFRVKIKVDYYINNDVFLDLLDIPTCMLIHLRGYVIFSKQKSINNRREP